MVGPRSTSPPSLPPSEARPRLEQQVINYISLTWKFWFLNSYMLVVAVTTHLSVSLTIPEVAKSYLNLFVHFISFERSTVNIVEEVTPC